MPEGCPDHHQVVFAVGDRVYFHADLSGENLYVVNFLKRDESDVSLESLLQTLESFIRDARAAEVVMDVQEDDSFYKEVENGRASKLELGLVRRRREA